MTTRRNLLQRIGLLSAGLYLGDLSIAQRYQAALAQPTARKLALLVGINQYPQLDHAPVLKGSLTDVELQRELLTHRFGFSPQDILTLVDAEATRSSIEAAFIAHLSDQARPGDIVVFHFSGYGCLVRTKSLLEQGEQSYGDQQVLVAYDAGLLDPTGAPILNAIYEETLFLLLRSLPTDQVTTLLDCGLLPTHALRCKSLRERSLPTWEISALLGAELTAQNRLLAQTQLTRDQVQVQRQAGQLPGLVLAAASAKQTTALERDYDGFSAGLLTSALTQQLWENTPAPTITIQVGKLSAQIATQVGASAQQPTAKGQNSRGLLSWSTSFKSMSAVGIVSLIDRRGKTGKLWLGGLPDALLEHYHLQSCFRALNRDPQAIPWLEAPTPTWVQLRSRQGKTAIAQHRSGPLLQQGLVLEEAIRVLPRVVSLRLALGSNLSRIERVDATSVVSMKRSSLRIVGSGQPADYIFTQLPVPMPDLGSIKISSATPLTVSLSTPPTQSYGLADLGGALIPNTIGDRGEVVKRAIERLGSTLDNLLAIKLLELSLNHSAAALRMSATLEQVDATPQPLMRLQSMGVVLPLPSGDATEPAIPKADKTSKVLAIPNGTLLQYRISNWDSIPIYLLLLGFNGGASAFASYALSSGSTDDSKPFLKPIVVQPRSSVVLPVSAQAWKASGTAGLNKIFIISTRQPLVQTLAAQMKGMKSMSPSLSPGFAFLPQPLAIAQAIFADLHQLSLPKTTALGIKDQGLWAFDIEEWATLQFVYTTV